MWLCILCYVKRYDYSEALSGKSYWRAKIAHMRSKWELSLQRPKYILGNLKKGSNWKWTRSKGNLHCCCWCHQTKSHKRIIKGVNFISNLKFTLTGIKTWRAYRIGKSCFKDKESRTNQVCYLSENHQLLLVSWEPW